MKETNLIKSIENLFRDTINKLLIYRLVCLVLQKVMVMLMQTY